MDTCLPSPHYRLRSGVQAWTDLEEVLLTEPNLRAAGEAHAPELPQSWWWGTSPAMKRHGSWIFAFGTSGRSLRSVDLIQVLIGACVTVPGSDGSWTSEQWALLPRWKWVPLQLGAQGALLCFTCPHRCVWYGFRGGLRLPCLSLALGSCTYCWRLKLYLWELKMLTPLDCKFPK